MSAGALSHTPNPLVAFKGPTSNVRGRGKGKKREGNKRGEGRGGNGREGGPRIQPQPRKNLGQALVRCINKLTPECAITFLKV